MIVVRVRDKRCINKYRLEFFDTEEVTEEIIEFVANNDRIHSVMLFDKILLREEFLEIYKK